MARVILGVGGGIAAYKACELLRRLTEAGHRVRVVPSASALEFVGASTWAALSGEPVTTSVWEDVHDVPHVALGRQADLVVLAPATANRIAESANGLAPDLLGNVLLTATCPVVYAPAMHTEMWEHPATQANVDTLRARGAMVIEPAVGRLTGADSGAGRLPEAAEIAAIAETVLAAGVPPRDLVGKTVVVTAGGTREYVDPVRYLGNRSSGKQGYAFAQAARDRGAQVVLISANSSLADPAAVQVVRVGTAEEMATAVEDHASAADVVVMAAAVADFRPENQASTKIKKSGGLPTIALTANPDILAGLAQRRKGDRPLLVGFAAETGDSSASALEHARDKFRRKGADVMVANVVGDGVAFEVDTNAATVLVAGKPDVVIAPTTKRQLADMVWDIATAQLRTA